VDRVLFLCSCWRPDFILMVRVELIGSFGEDIFWSKLLDRIGLWLRLKEWRVDIPRLAPFLGWARLKLQFGGILKFFASLRMTTKSCHSLA
jgi:hypothetical protein